MLTVSFSCEFLLFRFFSPKNSISYFLHQQGCWRADSPGFWSCQGSPSCWAVFIAALSHKGSTGWQRGLAVLALTKGASVLCPCRVSGSGTACGSCSSVPRLSLQPCLSFPGLCVWPGGAATWFSGWPSPGHKSTGCLFSRSWTT